MRAALVACLVFVPGLALFGCGTGSTDEKPAAAGEPAVGSGAISTVTVTGTAPQITKNALSIVLLTPQVPINTPVPSEPKVMNQLGRTFIPELLVIRAGQSVEFRNSEVDLHNVRVIETSTGTTVMNVAMLMGVVFRQAFDRPGIYSVQCDIHTAMFADVVVVETPYSAITDRRGAFSIPDVPLGVYTVFVQYGEKKIEQVVTIDASAEPLFVDATQ